MAKANATAANLGFEDRLWQAAEKLRGNMDAAEYKHVVLGLIFLKYISDAFLEKHAALTADNRVYVWGVYSYNGGATPNSNAAPTLLLDPYKGTVAIADVKVGGYSNAIGIHVLYANGEVWGANLNGYTAGELGIGSSNGPYQLVRARF